MAEIEIFLSIDETQIYFLSIPRSDIVTSLFYLGDARLLVLMSRLLFVLPARLFALTGLTSDLAAISILSSYVSLCASSLTFPYLYILSHAYVAFLL
jgi:hypothetical protein